MKTIMGLLMCSVLLGSCSWVAGMSPEQLEALNKVLSASSGCAHIQGSGGAGGAAVPMVGGAGGYGQGSITIARSGNTNASLRCGPEGATVIGEKE